MCFIVTPLGYACTYAFICACTWCRGYLSHPLRNQVIQGCTIRVRSRFRSSTIVSLRAPLLDESGKRMDRIYQRLGPSDHALMVTSRSRRSTTVLSTLLNRVKRLVD